MADSMPPTEGVNTPPAYDLGRDSLDVAVDRAVRALGEVAWMSLERDFWDLRQTAREATQQLMDAWERAE